VKASRPEQHSTRVECVIRLVSGSSPNTCLSRETKRHNQKSHWLVKFRSIVCSRVGHTRRSRATLGARAHPPRPMRTPPRISVLSARNGVRARVCGAHGFVDDDRVTGGDPAPSDVFLDD
jgi:hypothetical protein